MNKPMHNKPWKEEFEKEFGDWFDGAEIDAGFPKAIKPKLLAFIESIEREAVNRGMVAVEKNVPDWIGQAREDEKKRLAEEMKRDLISSKIMTLETLRGEIERIDVSGGGSGRRIKIQLQALLDTKIQEL